MERGGDAAGRVYLGAVALAVVDRERVAGVSLMDRAGERHGGVEAAGEQHDGARFTGHGTFHLSARWACSKGRAPALWVPGGLDGGASRRVIHRPLGREGGAG